MLNNVKNPYGDAGIGSVWNEGFLAAVKAMRTWTYLSGDGRGKRDKVGVPKPNELLLFKVTKRRINPDNEETGVSEETTIYAGYMDDFGFFRDAHESIVSKNTNHEVGWCYLDIPKPTCRLNDYSGLDAMDAECGVTSLILGHGEHK